MTRRNRPSSYQRGAISFSISAIRSAGSGFWDKSGAVQIVAA
jgi:hypothetical protein